jgi:hypothetical protein
VRELRNRAGLLDCAKSRSKSVTERQAQAADYWVGVGLRRSSRDPRSTVKTVEHKHLQKPDCPIVSRSVSTWVEGSRHDFPCHALSVNSSISYLPLMSPFVKSASNRLEICSGRKEWQVELYSEWV